MKKNFRDYKWANELIHQYWKPQVGDDVFDLQFKEATRIREIKDNKIYLENFDENDPYYDIGGDAVEHIVFMPDLGWLLEIFSNMGFKSFSIFSTDVENIGKTQSWMVQIERHKENVPDVYAEEGFTRIEAALNVLIKLHDDIEEGVLKV